MCKRVTTQRDRNVLHICKIIDTLRQHPIIKYKVYYGSQRLRVAMLSVKRFDGFSSPLCVDDCLALSIGQRCSKWRYRFGDRDRTVGSCNGLYEAPLAVSTIQEPKRISRHLLTYYAYGAYLAPVEHLS
jgi:hypothetical protein